MTNMKANFEFMDTTSKKQEKSDFIRKGVVGGYKNEMSEEFIKKFDDLMGDLK